MTLFRAQTDFNGEKYAKDWQLANNRKSIPGISDKQESQLRVGLQMVDIRYDLQSYFTSNYVNSGNL